MFLVGLTGGVATGKSTVSGMFRELGVPVIDADAAARRVVAPGTRAWHQIRAEFGPGVFNEETGDLDRAALRRIIFEDEDQRSKLNKITHPGIYRELVWEAAKCAVRGHQYVVLDLPLLFEAGVMVGYMHKVIVVSCETDLQLQRVMEQRRLTEKESMAMINAQMPLAEKEAKADFVIENSGSLEDTRNQVIDIHRRYLSTSKFHWKIRLILGVAFGGLFGLIFYVGKKAVQSLTSAHKSHR